MTDMMYEMLSNYYCGSPEQKTTTVTKIVYVDKKPNITLDFQYDIHIDGLGNLYYGDTVNCGIEPNIFTD